jgi:hypothetical protein
MSKRIQEGRAKSAKNKGKREDQDKDPRQKLVLLVGSQTLTKNSCT